MKFYYRAIGPDGKPMRGMVEGKDVRDAAFSLRKHKFTPVKIIPVAQIGMKRFFPFLHQFSLGDRIFFTRQLSSMLASGLNLLQALEIVKNQSPNPAISETVQSIIINLQGGKTFSQSLEKHKNLFSPIYVSLIRTAESSGLLDKVLSRLADNLEKQDELRRTIKGAVTYPIIVVIVMIIVLNIMMIFVIPQLAVLFTGNNVDLPLTTRIVIDISNFFKNFWSVGLGGTLVMAYLFHRWYKTEFGRRTVDKYLLKLPVFGKLLTQTIMAELTRTLGLLVGAGSLVVDSLIKSSDVVGNVLYKDATVLVARRVEKGITMGDAMEASPLFPLMVVEMVKIGEQTGKLDESLIKSSEYFEREVEETAKTLTTLLEPIIMIVLALAVGFLLFAIITPIYSIISTIN